VLDYRLRIFMMF